MKTLNAPFRWLGSKVRMRSRLLEIFETIPRCLYVEPFGGSGAMFFGKEPENSVYNDLNGLLVNFMRELRKESSRRAIETLARYTPGSDVLYRELRDLCKRYLKGDEIAATIAELKFDDYPTEVAVAFAFFYVQNFSFGGKPLDAFGYFNALTEKDSKFLPLTYRRNVASLDDFADKLRQTQVENVSFEECFEKHDDKQTFFYCDPPYECETSKHYKTGWTGDDTRRLVEILTGLKGSFVLSCYDGELYRPLETICEKRVYDARTCVSRKPESRQPRKECVYIKNNGARLLF